MKSLIPLARVGAVLSAVALLGGYVYVRSGGRLPSAAVAEGDDVDAPDSHHRSSGMTSVEGEFLDGTPPVATKTVPPLAPVNLPELKVNVRETDPARPIVMPSSKFMALGPEALAVLQGEPVVDHEPATRQAPLHTPEQPFPTRAPDSPLPVSKNMFVLSPNNSQQAGRKQTAAKPAAPGKQEATPQTAAPTVFPGSKSAPILPPSNPPPAPVVVQPDPRGLEVRQYGAGRMEVGGSQLITVVVSNHGNVPLKNIAVSGAVGQGLNPTHASAGFKMENGALTWRIETLGPSESRQLQFKVETQTKAPRRVDSRVTVSADGVATRSHVGIVQIGETSAYTPSAANAPAVQPAAETKQQKKAKPPRSRRDAELMEGSKSAGGYLFTEEEIRGLIRGEKSSTAPPSTASSPTLPAQARN